MTPEDLVHYVNRGLRAAQDEGTRTRLDAVELSYARSPQPALTLEVLGDRYRLRFSDGLFGFLSQLNNIVMCSIAGPESGDQPLHSYRKSFISALALAYCYFTRKQFIPLDSERVAVPRDHPYTEAVGALLIGQIGFVLAHEYAHILLDHEGEPISVLGHAEAGVAMPREDVELFRDQEREADGLGANMVRRYLAMHSDLARDLGVIGPGVFFQWLAFCESIVGTLLADQWVPAIRHFARRIVADDGDEVYVHLHGYPLGSERMTTYYSAVDWGRLSTFTVAVMEASGHIVESFLADAKDGDRIEAVLGQGQE